MERVSVARLITDENCAHPRYWQFLTGVSGQPIGHDSLHNSPEERSSHLLRGGSLKSRLIIYICNYVMEQAARYYVSVEYERLLCCLGVCNMVIITADCNIQFCTVIQKLLTCLDQISCSEILNS
jgi:hypothetical protein